MDKSNGERNSALLGRNSVLQQFRIILDMRCVHLPCTPVTTTDNPVLNLYRQSKGRAVHIATVNLPLVSDFARSRDERYPVRSVADDTVVGELRLSVSFQEVETFSLQRYNAVEVSRTERS